MQRGENGHRPENPAAHIAKRDAELHRHVAALAIDAERPGQRLRHDVEGRLVAEGPGEAKPADRAIDEARVERGERRVAEAEAVHHAGAVVFHENVGPRYEAAQDVGAGRLAQVDDQALLVAVDAEEIMALAADKRRKAAGFVAAAGRLDFQDFGAEIAEALGRERPRQNPGQVDDPDPLERPGPALRLLILVHALFRRRDHDLDQDLRARQIGPDAGAARRIGGVDPLVPHCVHVAE